MKKVLLKTIIAGVMVSVFSQGVVAFAAEDINVEQAEVNVAIEEVEDTDIAEGEKVEIVDYNLKKALKSNFGLSEDEDITVEMMENVTELDLSGFEVKSVFELQMCKNLEKLNVSGSDCNSYEFIVDLPKLKELTIRNCGISNVNIFTGMKALERLDIGENNISDISPLYNKLKNGELKYLDAGDQYIRSNIYIEKAEKKDLLPFEFRGITDANTTITSMVNNAVYDNETNTFKIDWSNDGIEYIGMGFNDFVEFDGVYYEYNGVIDLFIDFYEDTSSLDEIKVEEVVNKAENKDSSNTVKTTNTKSAKPAKTGDPSAIGTIALALASLTGLTITKKRK